MPRLTEERRRDRREQIAAAALDCFAVQGIADTSMADIIKAAGLSAGSIYSHFEGKADLMRFVAAGVLDARTRDLSTTSTSADFARAMLGPVDSRMANILLQVWSESARDPLLAALVKDNLSGFRTVFDSKVRGTTGSADPSFDKVQMLMQGYIVRLAIDPHVDPALLLTGVTELLDG